MINGKTGCTESASGESGPGESDTPDTVVRATGTRRTLMAATLGVLFVSLVYLTNMFHGSTALVPKVAEVEPEEVYLVTETMPELIGGLNSIHQQIRYPEIAKNAGIEGRVFLQFIVDEYGNVVDPVVTQGIGAGCDEAALKALKTVRFIPGRQRGEAVSVRMSLPVVFRLQ